MLYLCYRDVYRMWMNVQMDFCNKQWQIILQVGPGNSRVLGNTYFETECIYSGISLLVTKWMQWPSRT